MNDEILHHRQDNVLEITLNRPEKLNAFTESMHITIREVLETARDDAECRAILITANGRGFCTGQDLSARDPRKLSAPPDLGQTLGTYYNPLIRLLRSINKPIVCAVNGVAAGAGANLALACDIVIACKSARFIQSFAKVGLIPDAGGSWLLPALVGEARAKAIAMTAMPVTAEQAQDWGMIWKCVDDENMIDEARSLAQSLAAGPTFGLGCTKQALQSANQHSLEQQLDLEAQWQRECGYSKDYAEGVLSFIEKREASFCGEPPADAG